MRPGEWRQGAAWYDRRSRGDEERPPTVCRNRRRGPAREAAEQIAAQVEAGQAPTVTVDGYGPGWWVTAVDRRQRVFEVYRDGDRMTVPWSMVRMA